MHALDPVVYRYAKWQNRNMQILLHSDLHLKVAYIK